MDFVRHSVFKENKASESESVSVLYRKEGDKPTKLDATDSAVLKHVH
jgi:hypothetical protein